MPIIYVDTSLRDGAIPPDFESEFTNVISKVLNKPIENISIIMKTNQRISKGGDKSEPTCVIKIHSIGVFGKDKNGGYSKQLMAFLTKALKLGADRLTNADAVTARNPTKGSCFTKTMPIVHTSRWLQWLLCVAVALSWCFFHNITIILKPGQRISKGGDRSEPCCVIKIHSIGVFGKDKNGAYTKELLPYLTKTLKLEAKFIVVLYFPLETYMCSTTVSIPE